MPRDVFKIEAVIEDEIEGQHIDLPELVEYVKGALEDLGFVIKTLDIRTHQL